MNDYEDSIAEFETAYDAGDFEPDQDPEMAGRRAAREAEEQLDRQQHKRQSRSTLSEVVFVSPARQTMPGGRTLADVELELIAGRHRYRAAPWLTAEGPLAFAEVQCDRRRYAKLIELWQQDREGYEAELRRRRLVR